MSNPSQPRHLSATPQCGRHAYLEARARLGIPAKVAARHAATDDGDAPVDYWPADQAA